MREVRYHIPMGPLDKLKNRTEWQAYLITAIAIFADHFLGLKIDPDKLWMLVGLSGSYGASRGLAKIQFGVKTIPEAAAIPAPAPAAPETAQAGDAGRSDEEE